MSFRLKTIIGVALIEAVLLSILITSGLWYITNSAQKEFQQRVESIAVAFSVGVKDATLSSDLASLDSFVTEALSYPGVRYARVVDAESRTLAAAGDPGLLQRPFRLDPTFEAVDDGVMDTRAEVIEAGYLFGRVEIGVAVDELQHLMQSAKRYGFGIGLIEMLLVALFSFILGGYLTRQLADLIRGSRQVASGNLGYQLAIKGRDELAQTAEAFNTMSTRVADSYRQVEQREVFWHQVIDSSLDGIIVIDKKGVVLSFSAGAELMLGYRADEVKGRNVSMLVPDPHRERHDDYLRAYLEGGEGGIIGKSRDFTISRKDGRELPINLRVTEMNTGGDPNFIGVIHDISERVEYEQQLTRSLREKETLLKEIHHRVKNNLLVVSSILEMQEEEGEDSEINRVLRVSQDRIRSMALIHEKLYRSDTLAEVDFAGYLEQLVERLVFSYSVNRDGIDVVVEAEPLQLNVETATPLGLIVNELVTNSLKHAFAAGDSGEVRVRFYQSGDGAYTLSVSDNGRGLPQNFEIDHAESLGLQIVSLLTRQLDAKLAFERGQGVTASLTLEELAYRARL